MLSSCSHPDDHAAMTAEFFFFERLYPLNLQKVGANFHEIVVPQDKLNKKKRKLFKQCGFCCQFCELDQQNCKLIFLGCPEISVIGVWLSLTNK